MNLNDYGNTAMGKVKGFMKIFTTDVKTTSDKLKSDTKKILKKLNNKLMKVQICWEI